MKKIMLIDDDDIFVFLTKKTIFKVSTDISTDVFCDGQKALEHLQSLKDPDSFPDAILLDLNMPVMDGWEFLDEYKHIQFNSGRIIPLFIVSSSISPFEMERAAKIPLVREFIVKPMVKEKFLEILKSIS